MTDRRSSQQTAPDRPPAAHLPVLITVGVLIVIVLTYYGLRLAVDLPFLTSGTQPEPEDFEARYVAHPWLAYLHMSSGVLYLLGAPLQLTERFRTRHYAVHRRLGRLLVGASLFSVLFALIFGLRFPWGGTVQAVATAVFGCWFATCLALGVRAIHRGDVINHRRWMIGAFATGVAVGPIRIWIGLLVPTGLLDSPTASLQRSGSPSACISSPGNVGCTSPLPKPDSHNQSHEQPRRLAGHAAARAR